jgi:WD40 domain-containing protein
VNEQRLREALRSVPVEDARSRALDVVRAAYREAEPVPAPRRRRAPALAVLACLLAAAVVAVSVGSPGDAVARWVRQVFGNEHARPALVRVPGGGRLLVSSPGGPWVVAPDGSRRRLGAYSGASWSPHGLFVVMWRGGELVVIEPSGQVRWSLARRGTIAAARWAPVDGYRVAYLSGRSLRIVNGDGTGDRLLAGHVRAVAPAWRPDAAHVLAYAAAGGRVRVLGVDARRELWRARVAGITRLAWSPDGRRLAVAGSGGVSLFARGGRRLGRRRTRPGTVVDDVTWSPEGRLTVVRRGPASSRITVAGRTLFTGSGRFGSVAWSPGGRRLLVPWPAADQWLFLEAGGGRMTAVANIRRQFGPAGAVEWCCR